MLVRVALVAAVGFLAGAVAAAEPWNALQAPRPEASVEARGDVMFLARLRWFDASARSLELGRTAR
ncbi:MAG TPA: hypothetical protein VFP65_14315 [Anaeromyxobacteraceae bacterium]|nr:hypothetical protein [Anaeromyxobacteraceae bacterium]